MDLTTKRIVGVTLAVGIVVLVAVGLIRMGASNPPDELVLLGSLKQFKSEWDPSRFEEGASLSVSNANPEAIFYYVMLDARRIRRGLPPETWGILGPRESKNLGDYWLHDNQLTIRYQVTMQGSSFQRLIAASNRACREFWRLGDFAHARNVYTAEMKSKFLGQTHSYLKTTTVEIPKKWGEENPIFVHLGPASEEATKENRAAKR
ncbi:MAG: hypothetical protein HY043_22555 [Verrucomicrobia bacterium]|nr:hypothetical protein [Verrucomicrobiota bacterium]